MPTKGRQSYSAALWSARGRLPTMIYGAGRIVQETGNPGPNLLLLRNRFLFASSFPATVTTRETIFFAGTHCRF
jgi:hypothetical protein